MPRRRKRIAKIGPSSRRPGPRGRATGSSGGVSPGGPGLPAPKKLTNRPSARSGGSNSRPTGSTGTKLPRTKGRGEAVLGIDPGFGPHPVTTTPRHSAPRPRPNAVPPASRPMGRKPRTKRGA